MWECEWWKLYRTDVSVEEHLREKIPYKRLVRQEDLLNKINVSTTSVYVQCNIKTPEHLREQFANFPSFIEILNV